MKNLVGLKIRASVFVGSRPAYLCVFCTMTDRRDRYRALCAAVSLPLHLQARWFDATCGENGWDVVFAGSPDRPDGVWPFPKPDRFRRVGMPPFAAYGGPWLFYPQGAKRSRLYGFDKDVLSELVAGLPRLTWFRQNLLPETANTLPLQWAGFQTSVRYTYRLYPGTAKVWWEHLESVVRNKVNAAEKNYTVTVLDSPAMLWQLYLHSTKRMGVRPGGTEKQFRRLYESFSKEGKVLAVLRKSDDAPVAAQWLVVDEQEVHLIVGGKTDETGYANYFLLAGCVRAALDNHLGVDFEGSMHPGLEHVYRRMGGFLTPYFRVVRIK